jgi:hypothetical protein
LSSAVKTFEVSVVSPVPAKIVGETIVNQGEGYSLRLLPGDEVVNQWTIHWGDGSSDILSGGAGSAGHVYALGGLRQVTATVATPAGTHDVTLTPPIADGDQNFGSGGSITRIPGGDIPYTMNDVAVSGGDIVVVGADYGGSALVALKPDGTVDSLLRANSSAALGGLYSPVLATSPDGDVYVVGREAGVGIIAVPYVNGVLDNDNTRVISFASEDVTAAVASDNGTIDLVGYGDSGYNVAQIAGTGTSDTTWQSAVGFGSSYADPQAVVIQPDGKIVVAGYAGGGVGLARFNCDGTLDTTFGDAGAVVDTSIAISFGGGSHGVVGLSVLPDGKLLVATTTQPGGNGIQLSRVNSDGGVDSNFGQDGSVSPVLPGSIFYAGGMKVLEDGTILLDGTTGMGQIELVSFSAYGTLSGCAFSNLNFGYNNVGQIIVAGDSVFVADRPYGFGVARFILNDNSPASLTVLDALPALATSAPNYVNEHTTVSIPNSIADPEYGGGYFGFTIDWGDQSSPTIWGTGHTFDASHKYVTPGTYQVVVTPTDGNPSQQFTVVVVAAPYFDPPPPDVALNSGSTLSAMLAFADDSGGAANWSVWVNYGDGTSDTFNGSSFQLNHTYNSVGSYSLSIGIEGDGQGTDTSWTTIGVSVI